MAKATPDSFTPRKFINIMNMNENHSKSQLDIDIAAGKADVICATPEAMDTETL
jgi:hypothetical protein